MKSRIIALILALTLVFPFTAKAQIPFGGPILMTYECTCSGGWLIMVYDHVLKVPVPLVFQFGISMLRANYNIFTPGVQTTGSYTPGGICLMASLDCGGIPVTGTISPIGFPGVGTSAL